MVGILKENVNVLFVSSEVVPFSKTGGLADISGSLPKTLSNTINMTVFTPFYKNANLSSYPLKLLKEIKINMAGNYYYVTYYSFKQDNITYVFVKHPFYERDSFYGYHDDDERFFLFSYSALEYINVVSTSFDIIHLNDWQSAMIPYLLKEHYLHLKLYQNIKTLLSIHNLQFQGNFSKDSFKYTNKPFSYDYIHFDQVNFLKCGIMLANKINTVSHTYKEEIKTLHYGYSLDGSLRDRDSDLYGILNGIDYDLYNSETDSNLYFNYSKTSFVSGKKNNKLSLLKEVGLEPLGNIPLIGHVGRLANQKGLDLMISTLEETINKTNAHFIFLGSGESNYEEYLKYLMHKYPKRVFTHIGFSNRLAHLIYAASDLFLMPSLFEPCGLAQMISMRYGTLPIVRETGGLKDTVIPYNKYTDEGTGFSFTNYNAHEMMEQIITATNLYNNNQHVFRLLQKQALNQDFSLTKMGQGYLNIYHKLMEKE